MILIAETLSNKTIPHVDNFVANHLWISIISIMFIFYLLGILTGLVLDIVVFVLLLYFKNPLQRRLNQAESKMKEKGEVFVDKEDGEFSKFISELPDDKI